MATSMKQKKLIGMNTKMYLSLKQTMAYVNRLKHLLPTSSLAIEAVDIVFLPDFISLPKVAQQLQGTGFMYGGQECYFQDSGPYTGEVSAAMLKDLGSGICLLGHPERRCIFTEETYDDIAAKAAAVCRNGMVPMVCIGEDDGVETEQEAIDECSTLR